MEQLFKMAGNTAAHAMWSVSDGEVLIPILKYLDKENESRMHRLAFSDCDEAIAYGKQQLETNERDAKGAVFVYDGFARIGETKVDALLLNMRGYGDCAFACTLALPYRPKAEGQDFVIYRPALWEFEPEQKPLLNQHMDHFFDGIEGHATAAEFWKKHSVNDSPIANAPTRADGITVADWQLLCLSPCLVFMIVAAADGTVDKNEAKAFGEILQKPTAHPSRYLQKVLAETRGNVQGLIREILERGDNPLTTLGQVAAVVDAQMDEDEGFMFKLSLLAIGQQIAKASGGGFLGMGNKVSKEEQQALVAIAAVLKVLGTGEAN